MDRPLDESLAVVERLAALARDPASVAQLRKRAAKQGGDTPLRLDAVLRQLGATSARPILGGPLPRRAVPRGRDMPPQPALFTAGGEA